MPRHGRGAERRRRWQFRAPSGSRTRREISRQRERRRSGSKAAHRHQHARVTERGDYDGCARSGDSGHRIRVARAETDGVIEAWTRSGGGTKIVDPSCHRRRCARSAVPMVELAFGRVDRRIQPVVAARAGTAQESHSQPQRERLPHSRMMVHRFSTLSQRRGLKHC